MPGNKLENLVIKREQGEDLVPNIALITGRSPSDTIRQLIANSLDADSTQIRITLTEEKDPDERILIVQDDGHGMDVEGLESFIRTGDSMKKNSETSPGGRKLSGRFGISTKSIPQLGNEYEVLTSEKGKKFTLSFTENFNDSKIDANADIPVIKQYTDEGQQGTTITIKDLNFEEGKGFSIEKLKKDLARKFLPKSSYNIIVNDEIIESTIPKGSKVLELNKKQNKRLGYVSGNAFLLNKPDPEIAGVYLYSSGSQIGERDTFYNLEDDGPEFKNTVIIQIEADDLKFQLDKGGIIDKRVKAELRDYIKAEMKTVKQLKRKKKAVVSINRLEREMPKIVTEVQETINTLNVLNEKPTVSLKMVEETSSDDRGVYNESTGVMMLNKNYVGLMRVSGLQPKEYQVAMTFTAVDIIAESMARKHKPEEQLEEFNNYKAALFRDLTQQEFSAAGVEKLLGNAYYDLKDFQNLLGVSQHSLDLMNEAGMFEKEKYGYAGNTGLDIESKTNGFKSIYDLYRRHRQAKRMDDTSPRRASKNLNEKIKAIEKDAEPFIKNFSNNKQEFYMVEETCQKAIMDAITKDPKNMKKGIQNLANKMLSAADIGEICGINADAVDRIKGYADGEGIEIKDNFKDGNYKYKFGDFIKGLQLYRQEEKQSASIIGI